MKLRDNYPTLEALCDDLNIEVEELSAQLAVIDYHYNAEYNKFV